MSPPLAPRGKKDGEVVAQPPGQDDALTSSTDMMQAANYVQ